MSSIPSVNVGGGYGSGITPLSPGRATLGVRGGLRNLITGAGGSLDKINAGAQFYPSYYHPTELEVMYAESWAARKFVGIPVDDMLIRGRRWSGDKESAIDAMKEEERRLRVGRQLRKAMKGARLFGTSMMVMMTRGTPMHIMLDPKTIRKGDLLALPVFHRHQCTIAMHKSDPFDPDYGWPELYRVTPTIAQEALRYAGQTITASEPMHPGQEGELFIHASRILRFDGISPLTNEGWEGYYERDWGLSELAAVLEVIQQEITIAQATAQQVQEADIETIGIEGWRDIISGPTNPDDPTIEQIAMAHTRDKSVWRTRYTDADDTYNRSPINFANRPQLINTFHQRLAAAAGIPATRFLGQSPAGMNATGESDMKNYTIHVKANQESMLTEPLESQLDPVMARSAGLQEAPPYEWVPLMDLSDQEQADLSAKRVEALAMLYDRSSLDENEIREVISGDWLVHHMALKPLEGSDLDELRELHGLGLGGGDEDGTGEGGEDATGEGNDE